MESKYREKWAEAKIGEYKIPLIGINRVYGQILCEDCKEEFPIQEIKISYFGKFYCNKCSEE